MRAIKLLLTSVAVVALAVLAGVVLLHRYVQSAAFKQAVLDAARDALGADVRIGGIHVSLLTGAALEQVTLTNPPGVPGDLLSADALVVRYRLLPLLRKRLQLEQVSLERPVLRLARAGTGEWNYTKIGARAAQTAPPPGPSGPAAPGAPLPPTTATTLEIALPKLAVNGGEIVISGERGSVLARAQQLDLAASLSRVRGTWSGSGTASIDTLSVADRLFVTRLTAPVVFTSSEVALTPLSGTLADGDVRGDLTLKLVESSRFVVNLQVTNADVERVLREAGATRRVVRGKLQARATLEGTGGLATLVGTGRAEILSGSLVDVPALSLLATLLQTPILRDLRFEECRIEFALANGVLDTPVIRLISRDAQITGRGSVALATAALDHRLTLALPRATLDRAPREIRAAFADRSDGMLAVDFRVWGPYDAPKTDLHDRVLKGVTEQVLRRSLRRLFR